MWPANKAIETAGITSISPIIPKERIFGDAVHLPFNNNKLHGPSKYHGKKKVLNSVVLLVGLSLLF
jgi:hypothetical protein